VTGISQAEISRIERGSAPWLTIDSACILSAALGLQASLRFYPEQSPVRDRAHVALLECFRQELHQSLRWRTEVPLPIPGDLRAWDAVVAGSDWQLGVDAETNLHDVQAFERRLSLKQRDADGMTVILLVAATSGNRQALASARTALRGLLPHDTREILAAVRKGVRPPGSGIVVL
jgi:transcriptional regulator with XRE-family HTH domain